MQQGLTHPAILFLAGGAGTTCQTLINLAKVVMPTSELPKAKL